MFKIKNPYSNKRFSFKEKAQKNFTKIVVPWIKKIPLNEDYNAKRKFIPQSLNRVRINMEYRRRNFWTNDIPKEVEVNLVSMYVAEYIPIENIDKLNKGLKKVFKNFAPKTMNTNDISRIDDFCREVKECIHSTRWSRFGFIEVDIDNELSQLVKRISFNGTQISSSSVIIELVIEPSENFHSEYRQLIESNVEAETILTPKIKQFFKSWDSKTPSNVIVKEQMVEDLLLELKWRTLKEIGKYFDMYFSKNKMISPSIEVYKIKQKSCNFKFGEKEPRNQFWDSIGMRGSQVHEISKDGYWQLFANDRDSQIDSSIKLTCNEEISNPNHAMFQSHDSYIYYFMQEFTMNLFPIMVIRNFTLGLSKKIAIQQELTFKSIKKEHPSYNKLINIRYELEQNLQILKRFKNEMGEEDFEYVKLEILSLLKDFEPARPRFQNGPWGKLIVDNTSYLIDRTYNLSQNFARIIDDTVTLLEIKTNNSLRTSNFWLTLVTVILSLMATFFASMSLYLQLNDENKIKIKEFIDSITKFFT